MGPVNHETPTGTALEPADLDVGLASDTDVFDAAFRLVHDQYTWRGYMAPSPSGRRLSVHHALPTTKVFVARRDDRVIGTVTLVGDSLFGLPMDDLYRHEISTLRAQGRRIAEVSALATAAESRRTGITVLLHLMRALITYAVKLAALDDLCITVNPRHVEFYRSCMRFETIGGERAYSKVNGAPAVALRLNLEVARAIEASVHRGDEREPIYQFLCAHANQAHVLARLWENLASARFRRPQFIEFFGDGMLLGELSPAMRARVEGFFAPVAAERPCEIDIVRAGTHYDPRPQLRLAYA